MDRDFVNGGDAFRLTITPLEDIPDRDANESTLVNFAANRVGYSINGDGSTDSDSG